MAAAFVATVMAATAITRMFSSFGRRSTCDAIATGAVHAGPRGVAPA
jgi:hypothetical protein